MLKLWCFVSLSRQKGKNKANWVKEKMQTEQQYKFSGFHEKWANISDNGGGVLWGIWCSFLVLNQILHKTINIIKFIIYTSPQNNPIPFKAVGD